jgi:cbb3-type cytochrome oxidase subunit 1
MKSLPFWFIALASLFALAGMGYGIYMAASQDHTLSGAHAHNNLIGFVTMALYGVYYRLVPAAATTRLALVHFWLALIGAVTFGPGVAMAILGQGELLITVSSFAVILAMLIFAITVFRNRAALTV